MYFFILQGIRRIQIGYKLQEAAAHYQQEGLSRVYIVLAGTNTQRFINILEDMFGDLDLEDLDLEELETTEMKDHQAVAQAEEAFVSKEHGPIPADKVTRVVVRTTLVPTEFGIPKISVPELENIKIPSIANPAKKISRFYYNCKHCTKSSQNKASMMMHMRWCINIKLVCGCCGKEYDSADYMEKHINEAHGGDVDSKQ